MSGPAAERKIGPREIGQFLEIQNLGLNLPFALGFLLLAAHGLPSLRTVVLVVLAFIGARNAGHSFNRWADRRFDARNPRTQQRALVTGRLSPAFALTMTAASSALVVVAAAFLNELALVLAPVALVAIFLYSYTKRYTALTTAYLGFVEGITPAAVFIAVTGSLPWAALLATLALLAWGTAFETIHSLGDVEADRTAGLRSIPARIGVKRSVRLLPVLHAAGLLLLAGVGVLLNVAPAYYVGLGGMAGVVGVIDVGVATSPAETRRPFRLHFLGGALFLVGVAVALFLTIPL